MAAIAIEETAMLTSQIISALVLFWTTLFVGLTPSLIGNWIKNRNKIKSRKSSTMSKLLATSTTAGGDHHHVHDDHERNFPQQQTSSKLKSGSKSFKPQGHGQQAPPSSHGHGHGHSHLQPHIHHDHHQHRQEQLDLINQEEGGNENLNSRRRKIFYEKILSFLMNFGGGVLLATSFLHMLPEINEMNESLNHVHNEDANHHVEMMDANITSLWLLNLTTNHGTNHTIKHVEEDHLGDHVNGFPSPQLLICCGFFLIYFVEELMHVLLSHPGHTHVHDQDKVDHTIASQYYHNHHEHVHIHSRRSSRRERLSYGSVHPENVDADNSDANKLKTSFAADDKSKTLTDEPDNGNHDNDQYETDERTNLIGRAEDDLINDSNESINSVYSASIFKCIILVFALSFHSIFDGLAIGLQPNVASLINLSFAILIHKLPIAFVVGLDVYSKTNSVKIVIYHMFPFSLMSPIGIMIAAAAFIISRFTISILTALSTGSLIYITFFEILLREKMESKLSGFLQFSSVLTGFIFMAVILQFTSAPHQH